MSMMPFFVADRPMSLRALKGLSLQAYPNAHIGIMAHANTSQNFQQIFRAYPCDDMHYCDAVGGPCQHKNDIDSCPVRQYILKHTIKMCDSGIFTREGATLTYEQLFNTYRRMGVKFGVMIDVFRDSQETLESAKEALQFYEPFKEDFILVGVAQGKTIEEYTQNYRDLRALGFSHIAVGGLLKKVEKTARFTQVRDEEFMYSVLKTLRAEYPDDWLFALGTFSPSRIKQFKELEVWGDYKGWIFQYKKRNEELDGLLDRLVLRLLEHTDDLKIAEQVSAFQNLVLSRSEKRATQKSLSQELNEGRQTLGAALRSLYQEVQTKELEIADQLRDWVTHGLLDDSGEKLVCEALQILGKHATAEAFQILDNIHKNRTLKEEVDSIEVHLNQINCLIAERIIQFRDEDIQVQKDVNDLCDITEDVIKRTEREQRFGHVHDKITQAILALM